MHNKKNIETQDPAKAGFFVDYKQLPMSTRDERILAIRGRNRYDEGLQHLRVVFNGAREGALPSFRQRAERLIAFEQNLDEDRRSKIRNMLATGAVRSTEDALLLLESQTGDS